MLTQKPKGREIYYQLNTNKMEEVETWLAEYKAILSKRFEQLDDVLKTLQTQEK